MLLTYITEYNLITILFSMLPGLEYFRLYQVLIQFRYRAG